MGFSRPWSQDIPCVTCNHPASQHAPVTLRCYERACDCRMFRREMVEPQPEAADEHSDTARSDTVRLAVPCTDAFLLAFNAGALMCICVGTAPLRVYRVVALIPDEARAFLVVTLAPARTGGAT